MPMHAHWRVGRLAIYGVLSLALGSCAQSGSTSGPDADGDGSPAALNESEACVGVIGDFVWNDVGGTKGIQDEGELGLEGVRVVLKNGEGDTVAETTTDVDGAYAFGELCAGSYTVEVDESTLPGGFMQTETEVGDDTAVDNNPNPYMLMLETDESSDRTIDFGFMKRVCTATIGDYVWNDDDGVKGIQDDEAAGLVGIRMVLRDGEGEFVTETVTDADGKYVFDELCAGEYVVAVDETSLPSNFMQTATEVGEDRSVDNNPNPWGLTLKADDAEDLTVDFGFMERVCTGIIGDIIWNDVAEPKGIQDEGDSGLEGVRVVLRNADGELVAETKSNADGKYAFVELCGGDYVVEVDETTVPENWMQTPTLVGDDRTIDNNENPAKVNLAEDSSEDITIDFGYMEIIGGEGCSLGFWKNRGYKTGEWQIDPHTLFSDVFEDAFPGMTLIEVNNLGGGHLKALGRQTIAAYNNALHPEVDFDYSADAVVDMFNDAFNSGDADTIETLKDEFDRLNNQKADLCN